MQVVGWTLNLGLIALSLMFLAGYGGMVSLVQMTVASVAGYTLTMLGASSIPAISLFWPWWVAAPLAIAVAVVFGTFAGILSARTEGIYTIMITLAIAAAFFYLTVQNYAIFNGFNGFTRVPAPKFWGIDWNHSVPLYYLILFFAALGYVVVLYISRAPFGLALQGVRDNPRRMEAIGYNVTAHRVAAYAFAAFIAGIGGILMVWLNHQISPGTAGIQATIYLLVVAVVGGLSHPIGAFVGAFIFVILRTFALDALIVGRARRAPLSDCSSGSASWSSCFFRRTGWSAFGAAGRRACAATARGTGHEHRRRTHRGLRRRQRHRVARGEPAVRRADGARRHHAHGAAGRAPRRARFERRGQDHIAQLRDRRFPADVGHRALLQRGRHQSAAARAHPPGPAAHLPDFAAVPGPDGAREYLSRLPRRVAQPLLVPAHARARRAHAIGRRSHFARPSRNGGRSRLVGELAHGQQRQLEIALALAGAPRFILFDEPAAGLSPTERGDLVAILTALPPHIGYIIIEHDMDVALRVVESVTMMHNGRIFKEGAPHEIEADPEVQELYLGGGHG